MPFPLFKLIVMALAGSRVEGYLLHELIHAGGFSRVYLATSPDERPVVFRILRKSQVLHPRARHQFSHGLNLMCRLDHPNIVRCLARGSFQCRPYAALEFVEGKNLFHWIRGQDQSWQRCRFSAAAQLGRALQYLHENRILFLDLKLENILLSYSGELKLTDFDLACTFEEVARWWRKPAGTPGYLAPELYSGHLPTPASDVYSLGLVLRAIFPDRTDTPVDTFTANCLDPSPKARPTSFRPLYIAAGES